MNDPAALAFEIRRLSSRLIDRVEERPHTETPPGQLATRLARTFGLRPIDVDIALAVLAAELDAEFYALLASASAPGEAGTELGTLAALVPGLEERLAFGDSVGATAPIVSSKLVRRIQGPRSAQLAPTRRFRDAVSQRALLSSLPEFATMRDAPTEAPTWTASPPGLEAALAARTFAMLCIVSGDAGTGKTSWACWSASKVRPSILHIDVAAAGLTGRTTLLEIRELIEDADLAGVPIVLDNAESYLAADGKLTNVLLEVLTDGRPVLFLIARAPELVDPRLRLRALAHIVVDAPPVDVRRELWRASPRLTDRAAGSIADLVLTAQQIRNARLLVEHGGMSAVDAAIEQLPKELDLVLPDHGMARLDALVLPTDTRSEVVELINAIRARDTALAGLPGSRGRGISALLDGDSGTGKTFSCEVIAAEVGLPLMRVNVSSLIDKYVGETEKNLTRVFERAHALGGILFFDEADALFGTRTDVTRSQDRYANLETNLLLQLMEQSTGVVLLTTNLKRNIDQAFMRRIMFKVYFEVPEAVHRRELWKRHVVAERAESIDFARLGEKFELSGGSIRAAALRAAYRSTAAGRKLTTADLVECATLESAGMGRVATWK